MKKLMIAAAIALVATFAQAAKIGWTCAGAADYAGGNWSLFVGALNTSVDVATIKSAVEAGGLSSVAGAFATGTVLGNGSMVMAAASSPKTITWSGDEEHQVTDTYYAVMFVESEDGTVASYSAPASITLTNNSSSKTFQFSNQATAFGNNEFDVGNTPEPTSGLLLLVGLAGLALKRKRA